MEWLPDELTRRFRLAVRKLVREAGRSSNGSFEIVHERVRGGRKMKQSRRDRMPLLLSSRTSDGTKLGTER